jgi:hypothetical protein
MIGPGTGRPAQKEYRQPDNIPLMGSLSLQRLKNRKSTLPGLPSPVCFPFRFFQPPRDLLLPKHSGLVSYRKRSWDFPFRAFPSTRRRNSFEPRYPLDVFRMGFQPGEERYQTNRVALPSCPKPHLPDIPPNRPPSGFCSPRESVPPSSEV